MISSGVLTLAEMGAASLASLDAAAGKPRPDFAALVAPDAPSGSAWFASIYDMPFGEFSDEDFSRICIQDWEREYTVPIARARLRDQPFFSGRYDGDLLLIIGGNKSAYWERSPEQRRSYCAILQQALLLLDGPDAEGDYETKELQNGYTVYISADEHRKITDLQLRLCREA